MFNINTTFFPDTNSKAYLVGGTVRDLILGRPPEDFDIAVAGDAKIFASHLCERLKGRLVILGKSFNQIYRVVSQGAVYDVAPIRGTCIEEDLSCRDYNINAIAYHITGKSIIDPFNGIGAIHNKTIGMISEANLQEDPLRLLRAFRLASSFQFDISDATLEAIQRHCGLITRIAGERIRAELLKMFRCRRSYRYLHQCLESGLLSQIFPELTAMIGCSQNRYHRFDVLDHSLSVYVQLESLIRQGASDDLHRLNAFVRSISDANGSLLKCTALLHDIGKPPTRTIDSDGTIHFIMHEKVGEQMIGQIGRRLAFSKRDIDFIATIVRYHLRPAQLFNAQRQGHLKRKGIYKFFKSCHGFVPLILVHAMADFRGKGETADTNAFDRFLERLMEIYVDDRQVRKTSPPLVTGNDLIHCFGLSPSPVFKTLLQRIDQARFINPDLTRKQALALVENFLKNL